LRYLGAQAGVFPGSSADHQSICAGQFKTFSRVLDRKNSAICKYRHRNGIFHLANYRPPGFAAKFFAIESSMNGNEIDTFVLQKSTEFSQPGNIDTVTQAGLYTDRQFRIFSQSPQYPAELYRVLRKRRARALFLQSRGWATKVEINPLGSKGVQFFNSRFEILVRCCYKLIKKRSLTCTSKQQRRTIFVIMGQPSGCQHFGIQQTDSAFILDE
jgi:hypothetical protein